MCREAGRRCPCDTSAKRQARRVNSKLKQSAPEPIITPQERSTVAEVPVEILDIETVSVFVEDSTTKVKDVFAGIRENKRGLYGVNVEDWENITNPVIELGTTIVELAKKEFDYQNLEDYLDGSYDGFTNKKLEVARKNFKDLNDNRNKLLKQLQEPVTNGNGNQWFTSPNHLETIQQNPTYIRNLNITGTTTPEEEAFIRSFNENRSEIDSLRHRINGIEKGLIKKFYEARKVSILKTMEHVRGAGGKSDQLSGILDKKISKKLATATDECLQVFPEEWVTKATEVTKNRDITLYVRGTSKRAHFAPATRKRETKLVTDYSFITFSKNIDPIMYQSDARTVWINANEVTEEQIKEYGINPEALTEAKLYSTPGDVLMVKIPYKLELHGQPTKRGWERYEEYDDFRYGQQYYGFRKKAQIRKTVDVKAVQEVTIGTDYTESGFNISVGTHEFAHYLEYSNPRVGYACQAFLHRRKKDENLSLIYQHRKKEEGWRDSFATHYMGKTYGDSTPNTEILSMGVEALFYGKHGGFIEKDDTDIKEDPEYQNFIVGLLAMKDLGVR